MNAKVAVVKCESYEPGTVMAAVRRAVDLVGGMAGFVKPGSKVVLKPNLLSARFPEEGVDTHPEVVRAVARLAKEAGGVVSAGDSPGGYEKDFDEVFEKSGMKKVAAEEGIELVKFSASRNIDGFPVSRHVLDADVVISIPKLKTHGITTLTAGVKNMYGVLTGLFKAHCHVKSPKEAEFAHVLAKVYSLAKPHLTVVDAVTSMEGDGPSSGDLRNTRFIAASADAVAVDAVLAKIVGVHPLDLAVTRVCYEQKLGEADLALIEIAGDGIDEVIVSDFKLPQTKIMKMLPNAVVRGVASLIKFRPVIDEAACKRCNLCKLTCPAGAITIEPDGCEIDYRKCVRCLCCQEVCPYRAIRIKRNILAKMVLG